MDRMIYVAMSGAKQTMEQQASIANNMANVSTAGFRAQLNNFRAVPVVGEGAATRPLLLDEGGDRPEVECCEKDGHEHGGGGESANATARR